MRLFAALDVPDSYKSSIDRAIRPLRERLPKARWTSSDQWHVTLKFLGEVAEEAVPEVRRIVEAAASESESVSACLTDVGSFPNSHSARVLWVGLEDAEGVMGRLASSMRDLFGAAGFRLEGSEFHPHLTVARFRVPQPVGEVLDEAEPLDFDRSPFDIAEIVLYRSRLSPKGAAYQPMERFHLGGPGV